MIQRTDIAGILLFSLFVLTVNLNKIRAGDAEDESSPYLWVQTDTTFGLHLGDQVVWQYNFNTKYGKPFFHPVYVGKSNVTCLSPGDHVWHLGQWFSWKYINGVNYWECNQVSFRHEGETRIKDVQVKREADFSAKIHLQLEYAPANEDPVMIEERTIHVSPPAGDNSIWMDYEFLFRAIADEVILDRTPLIGEPGGKPHGGYAGLSIRFNQDFSNPVLLAAVNEDTDLHGKRDCDWLYMGFEDVNGEKVGSLMMVPPDTKREHGAWFIVNKNKPIFYYISPSYIFYKDFIIKKDQTLRLNYRILHLPGESSESGLERKYQEYLKD